jgi:hypothetical protein
MKEDPRELIRSAIFASDQTNLFAKNNDADLEAACVRFLRHQGYRVGEPFNYKYKIVKLDDLISFFYTLLDSRHPEYVNVYRNAGRDRSIASSFIKNRVETTGVSEAIALKECAAIIETVFTYEKEFKFKTDVFFGMFGQANLSWVTSKAVEIMNKRITKEAEEKSRQDIERIEREQQVNFDLGFKDIDSVLARIEEEEKDG